MYFAACLSQPVFLKVEGLPHPPDFECVICYEEVICTIILFVCLFNRGAGDDDVDIGK